MPDPATPPSLVLDGYTDLPRGTIATVVSFLERTEPLADDEAPPLGSLAFSAIGCDVPRYRALYAAVGEEWLWFSRCGLADDALAAILGHPDVEAFAVMQAGREIGLVELDWRREGEAEIEYFGLVADCAGRGLGRAIMGETLRRAFARAVRRVTVHTCTLDHPSALGFYQRCGFRCYRRAVEVAPDPRLVGTMPRAAGRHHPVLA